MDAVSVEKLYRCSEDVSVLEVYDWSVALMSERV